MPSGCGWPRRSSELLDEEPIPGVQVLTSTRAGFELIDLLAGADRAILVDCLEAAGRRSRGGCDA